MYIYSDSMRVVMGSPLSPVIANIFMIELESVLVPKLQGHFKKWRRSVDDTLFMSSLVQLNMFYLC